MTELHHITQWSALRQAWWPLAVAVAWVRLRSRSAVEQLLKDRHSRKPITFRIVDIWANILKVGGQHTVPEFENADAAFLELQHPFLETGEIKIVGTRFYRVGDLVEGSARTELEEQDLIPHTKISSLIPFDDHGNLCLIPREWDEAHGSSRANLRGYRNVQVQSATLVRAFPEATQSDIAPDAVVSPEIPLAQEPAPPASAEPIAEAKPAAKRGEAEPSTAALPVPAPPTEAAPAPPPEVREQGATELNEPSSPAPSEPVAPEPPAADLVVPGASAALPKSAKRKGGKKRSAIWDELILPYLAAKVSANGPFVDIDAGIYAAKKCLRDDPKKRQLDSTNISRGVPKYCPPDWFKAARNPA
jgi:hypothetical protein